MASNRTRILIVSDDPATTAEAVQHVVLHLDADVTVVDTVEEAGVATASGAFDAILTAEKLSDGDALSLIELHRAGRGGGTPIFVMTARPDAERSLTALRKGAEEVFARPLAAERIVPVLRRAIGARRERLFKENRSRRLRRLSARLVRDRREMRQRVDLICRDVVQAYRRLAEKAARAQGSEDLADPGGRMDPLRRNT